MSEKYRLIISPRALSDLVAAYAFIAKDSPDNAAEWVARILRAIDLLEIIPHRFIPKPSPAKGGPPIRTLPVQSYVIYFRVIDSQRVIRVLTIRHGARRRPRRFD